MKSIFTIAILVLALNFPGKARSDSAPQGVTASSGVMAATGVVHPAPAPSAVAPVPFVPRDPQGVFVPPSWFAAIVLKVNSLPVIGPIVVSVMKWLGVIAAVMSALFVAFFSVMKVLSGAASMGGAVEFAQKVDALYVKVAPYLKYFSTFNAQKNEFKQE